MTRRHSLILYPGWFAVCTPEKYRSTRSFDCAAPDSAVCGLSPGTCAFAFLHLSTLIAAAAACGQGLASVS
eukprot:9394894-Alexandrium_andersonii.AAC.1